MKSLAAEQEMSIDFLMTKTAISIGVLMTELTLLEMQ